MMLAFKLGLIVNVLMNQIQKESIFIPDSKMLINQCGNKQLRFISHATGNCMIHLHHQKRRDSKDSQGTQAIESESTT